MYVAWRHSGVKYSGELSDVLRNIVQRKNLSPVACLKTVGPVPPEAGDAVVYETSSAYVTLQERVSVNLSAYKYYTDYTPQSTPPGLHVLVKTRAFEGTHQPQDTTSLSDVCTPLAHLLDSPHQSVCQCTLDQYVSIIDLFFKRSIFTVPKLVEVESVTLVDVTGTPQSVRLRTAAQHTEHTQPIPSREIREKTKINILIYVGSAKEIRPQYYTDTRDALIEGDLDPDSYTMYELSKHDLLLKNWMSSCELLVVADPEIGRDEVSCKVLEEYFELGGHLLTSATTFDERFCPLREYATANKSDEQTVDLKEVGGNDIASVFLPNKYFVDTKSLVPGVKLTALAEIEDNKLVILEGDCCNGNNGKAVFSKVDLHRKFKSRHLLMRWLFAHLGVRIDPNIGKKQSTECQIYSAQDETREAFVAHLRGSSVGSISEDRLTIADVATVSLEKPEEDPVVFDWKGFAENLRSKSLGNILLFQGLCPSTQLLLQPFNSLYDPRFGVVAIARQQSSGIGRGSNQWISPAGSLSLSLQIAFPINSNLGRAPAILQTIPAVAAARVFSQYIPVSPQSTQCKVSVKWPNDIYYQQSKIGGVIASCTTAGDQLIAIVGVGVNVSNLKPTMNVNDIIRDYNRLNDASLPLISVGTLAAKMCTDIEYLIELMNKDKREYLNEYYKHWMHSGKKVRVPERDDKESLVVGLDEHGYLRLQSEDGSAFSVQPDGNSYDILHNLITIKPRI